MTADANTILRVAQIVPCTEAEGPGKRFALWFQGCPLRCPGCCNPEMLPFDGGEPMTLAEVVDLLRRTHEAKELEGITLLGGEPTAHAVAATALARLARNGQFDLKSAGSAFASLHIDPEKADPAIS